MLNAENPVRTWDMEEYDPAKFESMWTAFNALPLHSVVATGFQDDGLVYWEKTSTTDFRYTVLQADHPGVADVFVVGMTTDSPVDLDAGGDIEVAHVIREGAGA